MQQQPLKKSVLHAHKTRKMASYQATNLALMLNEQFEKNKATSKLEAKVINIEHGLEVQVPMKVEGGWKQCACWRWVKIPGAPGPVLEYDPRVVTIQ